MGSYFIILVMLVAFAVTIQVAKRILVGKLRREVRAAGFNTDEVMKVETVFHGDHQASKKRLLTVVFVASIVALGTGSAAALILASIGRLSAVTKKEEPEKKTSVTVLVIEEDDEDGGIDVNDGSGNNLAGADSGVWRDSGVDLDSGQAKAIDAHSPVIPDAMAAVRPTMARDKPQPMTSPGMVPTMAPSMSPGMKVAVKLPPGVSEDELRKIIQKAALTKVKYRAPKQRDAVQYFLRKCGRGKVIHVRRGKVRCLSPGSKDAMSIIKRGLKNNPAKQQIMRKLPPVMRQSVFAASTDIANDMAKRKTLFDKLAEVIYFMMTLIGVVCRLWWDHALECRRQTIAGRESEKFNFNNLILAPFLAIAVHLVLTKSMSSAYSSIQFQGVLLAVYNGFVWPVLIKDISDFKNIRPLKANGQTNLGGP